MKTYEDYIKEFETEKEYSREDVKEILDTFGQYNDTLASFIAQFERVFLISGEACGFDVGDKD